MNLSVVVLLLVLFGAVSCGGSPEAGNALPDHQLSPPVQEDEESIPPVDSEEEAIPDADEDYDLVQEPEIPLEPPVFEGIPDEPSVDYFDDYVAEDDDRILDDDLDSVEETDPELDHCSLLEQVAGS